MTDLVEIGMEVDSSDVTLAKTEMAGFAAAWSKAVASIVADEKRLERAAKASADVQAKANDIIFGKSAQKELEGWFSAQRRRLSMMKESERMAQQQAVTEAKLTREIIRQREASDAAAIASAKAFQSGIGGRLGLGSTNAIGNGAGFAAMESEIERLKLKYDSAYAASALFEKQQKELNFAMLNGAGNADTLRNEMDKLQAEYAAFNAGSKEMTNRFVQQNAVVAASRQGVNKWGLLVQQSGYQVGDFLVQIQSGTNAFVAFGQQATQLVGILPMFASEIGISAIALSGITLGLSIAIPLVTAIGAAFMRTAKDAESSVKTIDDVIKSLNSELENLKTRVSEAKFGVDSAAEADALQKIADLNLQVFKKKQEYQNTDSLTTRQRLTEEWSGLQNQAAGLQVIVDKIEDQRKALSKIHSQELENIHQHQVYYDSLNKAYNDILENEKRASEKATFLKNVFHAMAGETGSISSSLSGWAGKLVAATKAAYGLRSALDIYNLKGTQGANMTGRGLPSMPGGPQYHGIGGVLVLPGSETPGGVRPKDKPDFTQFEGTSSGGGGGGSSEDTIRNQLKGLYEYLNATKQINQYLVEEEDISFKQREDLLKSALDKKLLTLQDYQAMEVDLTRRHQEELAKIELTRQNMQLQDTSTFFGGLAAVMQAGGDRLARIGRIASAAQALTNSYLAFTQVLADPSLVGRPWARFGMAASALASGLQAVAAIKGGGGGSISAGSVGTSSTGSVQAPQQVIIQGLKPTDIFTGEMLSGLFDGLYKENRNRGMVFMVQR